MRKRFNQVYQFKIALENIKPPIWRRILVPETYSFWDFHVAFRMKWIRMIVISMNLRQPIL